MIEGEDDLRFLFSFVTIAEVWNVDKIISESIIHGTKQCIFDSEYYQFTFRPSVDNVPFTKENKTIYLTAFFDSFLSNVFKKIQNEINDTGIRLLSGTIPNIIDHVAFLITFTNNSMVHRSFIIGTESKCELETVTVPFLDKRTLLPGSKKIGEGTYGCLHNPSLICEEKQVRNFYSGKVSKILSDKHMREEMAQYKIIDAIDPDNQYHPSAVSCTPKIDQYLHHSVGKCRLGTHIRDHIDDYKLIVMDHAGDDLLHLCADKSRLWSALDIRNLFIDSYNLFEAVNMFRQEGFVHQDIKPANIVYNISTRTMKLIDFGLSDTADAIFQKIENQNYKKMTIFHYNFPPELFLFRKKPYTYNDTDNLKFHGLLSTILNYNYMNDMPSRLSFIVDSKKKFQELKDSITKLDVAESIDTFDSYALGITFQFLYHTLPRFDAFAAFYHALQELISSLICMNVHKRMRIDVAIVEYTRILDLIPLYGSGKGTRTRNRNKDRTSTIKRKT